MYLVRHGEESGPARKLNNRGTQQAKKAAEVIFNHLQRRRATEQPIVLAATRHIRSQETASLISSELYSQLHKINQRPPEIAIEINEICLEQDTKEMVDGLARLQQRYPDHTIIAVGHVHSISYFLNTETTLRIRDVDIHNGATFYVDMQIRRAIALVK